MATRILRTCVVVAALLLTGCAADSTPDPNAADRAFLQQMIPHHQRAVAVGRLGITGAPDVRVAAFAARIVREQTPELRRMAAAASGLGLDLHAGSQMARHRITDAELRRLSSLTGSGYDQDFVRLHIVSETGAAEMARTELRDGHDPDVLAIARPIATAPTTQIPELRRLLVALGG